MYDIICIGSSIVDSFITSAAFQLQKTQEGVLLCQTYGEKIDVDEYIVKTGGGGSNTAVGFARMGFKTGLISELGADTFAKFIVEELHQEFVSTQLLITEKHENTGGSIILLSADGGRTIMVHRGAAAHLDPTDIPRSGLARTKWVHLSSIAGRHDTLEKIFSVVMESGGRLSWNPGNQELELLQKKKLSIADIPVTILFVNAFEWEAVAELQLEILEKIPVVVVTKGSQGGTVFQKGEGLVQFTTKSVQVEDETGAGDAFAVGFVTAYQKKMPILSCCEWGKKNAESVIAQVGAKTGLLKITEVEKGNEK